MKRRGSIVSMQEGGQMVISSSHCKSLLELEKMVELQRKRRIFERWIEALVHHSDISRNSTIPSLSVTSNESNSIQSRQKQVTRKSSNIKPLASIFQQVTPEMRRNPAQDIHIPEDNIPCDVYLDDSDSNTSLASAVSSVTEPTYGSDMVPRKLSFVSHPVRVVPYMMQDLNPVSDGIDTSPVPRSILQLSVSTMSAATVGLPFDPAVRGEPRQLSDVVHLMRIKKEDSQKKDLIAKEDKCVLFQRVLRKWRLFLVNMAYVSEGRAAGREHHLKCCCSRALRLIHTRSLLSNHLRYTNCMASQHYLRRRLCQVMGTMQTNAATNTIVRTRLVRFLSDSFDNKDWNSLSYSQLLSSCFIRSGWIRFRSHLKGSSRHLLSDRCPCRVLQQRAWLKLSSFVKHRRNIKLKKRQRQNVYQREVACSAVEVRKLLVNPKVLMVHWRRLCLRMASVDVARTREQQQKQVALRHTKLLNLYRCIRKLMVNVETHKHRKHRKTQMLANMSKSNAILIRRLQGTHDSLILMGIFLARLQHLTLQSRRAIRKMIKSRRSYRRAQLRRGVMALKDLWVSRCRRSVRSKHEDLMSTTEGDFDDAISSPSSCGDEDRFVEDNSIFHSIEGGTGGKTGREEGWVVSDATSALLMEKLEIKFSVIVKRRSLARFRRQVYAAAVARQVSRLAAFVGNRTLLRHGLDALKMNRASLISFSSFEGKVRPPRPNARCNIVTSTGQSSGKSSTKANRNDIL